jgi:hypothetical protein
MAPGPWTYPQSLVVSTPFLPRVTHVPGSSLVLSLPQPSSQPCLPGALISLIGEWRLETKI